MDNFKKCKKGGLLEKISLREARLQANLTTTEIAEKVGVSQSTITRWETGVARPNNAEMFFLACEYGLEAGDIFLP